MSVCRDKKRNQLLIERFSYRIDVNGSGKFGHALLALVLCHDVFPLADQACELVADSLSVRVRPCCNLVPPKERTSIERDDVVPMSVMGTFSCRSPPLLFSQ